MTYTVTRDCCTSGNCVTCIGVTPVGKPMRVVQQSGVTKQRADVLLKGWRDYKPAIAETAQ